MARYKGWKTSFKDVVEFNRALSDASNAVSRAMESLVDDVGLSEDAARSLLPFIPEWDAATTNFLHGEFLTRADFEREKSRLNRIAKAGEAVPRKGVVSIAPDNANQLTSFYIDSNGNILESQYMRRETSLVRTMQNNRRLRELAEHGIEFERHEVYTSEGKRLYDENRHVVTVLMPKTPNMAYKYRDIIQRQPHLTLEQAEIPELPEGTDTMVNWLGDWTPVGSGATPWGELDIRSEMEQSRRRRNSERIAGAVLIDEHTAMTTGLYFDNYKDIADTVLPKDIADEIGDYIDRIRSLPPSEQWEFYKRISSDEDVAGSIEFLYLDTTMALPSKVRKILGYWREHIRPRLAMGKMEAPEPEEIEDSLNEMGYSMGGLYPVFAEYNRRRADEPKGRWRKSLWKESHGESPRA